MKQIESFFWGIIAALGALIIELFVFIGVSLHAGAAVEISFSQLYNIPQFVILAVCIEEIFKYLIISKRVELVSLEKSYVINSFFVGAGFFAVELGLIAQKLPLPPLQALTEIAIIHVGTAGIIGYIVATKNPKKVGTFLSAVLIAAIFHVAYNFLSLNRNFATDYVIFGVLGLLVLINIGNLFSISRVLARC